MPFGGFVDSGGTRRAVNVLTAEEPTDWGGGSGLRRIRGGRCRHMMRISDPTALHEDGGINLREQ
jgi:hypothetical protein